jgi:predicted phosphodiesterase
MKMEKNRVAIDWNHDPDQLIGYLNKFDISSGDLIASGALVPYGENDKATEIIFKAAQGVPYEASISFPGGDQAIEVLDENQFTEVNGRQFAGPGVIFREWTLRGVAICAMGADHRTSAEFSDEEKVFSVRVINPGHFSNAEGEETDMAAEIETEIVEATETEVPVENAEEAPAVVEAPVESKTPEELRAEEGARFMAAFGEKGAMLFAMGKTFEAARDEFMAEIKAENEALKAKTAELASKLASVAGLGEAPVTASAASAPVVPMTFMEKATEYQKEKGCSITEAFRITAKAFPDLYADSKKAKK